MIYPSVYISIDLSAFLSLYLFAYLSVFTIGGGTRFDIWTSQVWTGVLYYAWQMNLSNSILFTSGSRHSARSHGATDPDIRRRGQFNVHVSKYVSLRLFRPWRGRKSVAKLDGCTWQDLLQWNPTDSLSGN